MPKNPLQKLKAKLKRRNLKVGPAPAPQPRLIRVRPKTDPRLLEFMWLTLKGRQFKRENKKYGQAVMTLLRAAGLKKHTGNQVVPTAGEAVTKGNMAEGVLVGQTLITETTGFEPADDAVDQGPLLELGLTDHVKGELEAFAEDLGISTIPVLAQLSATFHLIKSANGSREVRNIFGSVNEAHDALETSTLRDVGIEGLLQSLSAKKQEHKLNIGRYSIDLAVTFVPAGSAVRAVTASAAFALKIAHAARLHKTIIAVNKVLAQPERPAEFDLGLFEQCPLLAYYVFLYPGTSQVLGLAPVTIDPTESDLQDLVDRTNAKGAVYLAETYKTYAENIKKHAIEAVKNAPYELTQQNIVLPFVAKIRATEAQPQTAGLS